MVVTAVFACSSVVKHSGVSFILSSQPSMSHDCVSNSSGESSRERKKGIVLE